MVDENIAEIVVREYDKMSLQNDEGSDAPCLLISIRTDSPERFDRNEVVKLREDLQRWLDYVDEKTFA